MKLKGICENCKTENIVEYKNSRTIRKSYFITSCKNCKEVIKVKVNQKKPILKKSEIPNLLKNMEFRIKYM